MFSSTTPTANYQYVDIDVCNNNLQNTAPKPLIFNQTKDTNIIDKASDYEVSVVRWMADSTLPVFICEMETSTANVAPDNKTVYFFNFGIGFGPGSIITLIRTLGENVIWSPQNQNPNLFPNYSVPTRKPSSQIDVLNNPYYYTSSIQYVLELFNTALQNLYTRLMSVYSVAFPKALAPQFNWNASTNSIDLVLSKEFTSFSGGQRIYITMNAPLYDLLNTFSFQTNYSFSSADPIETILPTFNRNQLQMGIPFMLYTNYRYDLPNIIGPLGITLYQFIQESSSVPSWTPVSSIVFTSYSIPVIPSASGTPQFLGLNPYPSNTQNGISNVITDFEINMNVCTELANSVLQYQPSAEYRIISLNSDEPIRVLNFKVSWKSKYGTYHDFFLKYGGSASLKLMFRKLGYTS